MKLNAEGLSLIKSREGCHLTAYRCPGGTWTIGYGHAGSEVHDGQTIDASEAETLLTADVVICDAIVSSVCPVATPDQHAAMVSLCFNIGAAAFRRSSVARLHNAGRKGEAAQAFALWNKADGRILPGLVARRAAEASLYLSDVSSSDEDMSLPVAAGEKPLSTSRTLAGVTVTGTAVATAAVGEIVNQINDWRAALGDLVPYFAELRWLLLGLMLAGLTLSSYARWRDRCEGRN